MRIKQKCLKVWDKNIAFPKTSQGKSAFEKNLIGLVKNIKFRTSEVIIKQHFNKILDYFKTQRNNDFHG